MAAYQTVLLRKTNILPRMQQEPVAKQPPIYSFVS
jgi:hypothetical protein